MQKWNIRTIDYRDLCGEDKKQRREHFWQLIENLDLYETWVVHPAWIGLNIKLFSQEYGRFRNIRPRWVHLKLHSVSQGILCVRVDLKQGNNDATN